MENQPKSAAIPAIFGGAQNIKILEPCSCTPVLVSCLMRIIDFLERSTVTGKISLSAR